VSEEYASARSSTTAPKKSAHEYVRGSSPGTPELLYPCARMTTHRNFGSNRSPALQYKRIRTGIALALTSLGLCGICACDRAGAAGGAVSAGRVYAPVGRSIEWNASSDVRFGFDRAAFMRRMTQQAVAEQPAAPAAVEAASSLRWNPPAQWKRGPDKAMREVTYLAGEKGEIECYVSLLSGEGGGLASNLARWRGQLGQPPLTDEEIANLPRFPMLGVQAVSIEIARAATQTDGPELVLGAVCLRPGQSVFVKMLGPRASVEAQREAFLQFCRSAEGAP